MTDTRGFEPRRLPICVVRPFTQAAVIDIAYSGRDLFAFKPMAASAILHNATYRPFARSSEAISAADPLPPAKCVAPNKSPSTHCITVVMSYITVVMQ